MLRIFLRRVTPMIAVPILMIAASCTHGSDRNGTASGGTGGSQPPVTPPDDERPSTKRDSGRPSGQSQLDGGVPTTDTSGAGDDVDASKREDGPRSFVDGRAIDGSASPSDGPGTDTPSGLPARPSSVLPPVLGTGKFRHPGIFNTEEELEFIRATVATEPQHPLSLGFARMMMHPFASLTYAPMPRATVTVVANGGGGDEQVFKSDARAAYVHALAWAVTGKPEHKAKSIEIMNGWSAVFRGMDSSDSDQAQLEAAWVAPMWAAAAEIIRHFDNGAAGWPAAEATRLGKLLDVLHGEFSQIGTTMGNNWSTSGAMALMAVGVYQDSQSRFDRGRSLWKSLLSTVFPASGAVNEVCRDCVHPQYTIIGMVQGAEIAWHQGFDLYSTKVDGQARPRMTYALDFFADVLTTTPHSISCDGSSQQYSCATTPPGVAFEMAYNHYKWRSKIDLPKLEKLILTRVRPEGPHALFIGWSTATHAELNGP